MKYIQVAIGLLHMNEYLEGMPQTELIFSPLTCALPLLTLEFPIEVNEPSYLPCQSTRNLRIILDYFISHHT